MSYQHVETLGPTSCLYICFSKNETPTYKYPTHNNLLWGESSSPTHYDKNDRNRLKEINLKAHKEQTLISTHFLSQPHSQINPKRKH